MCNNSNNISCSAAVWDVDYEHGEQRRDLACIHLICRARADFFAISCDLPLEGMCINEKGIPAR
jgi:hypothetical protein